MPVVHMQQATDGRYYHEETIADGVAGSVVRPPRGFPVNLFVTGTAVLEVSLSPPDEIFADANKADPEDADTASWHEYGDGTYPVIADGITAFRVTSTTGEVTVEAVTV